jgi:hypothetical protein
MPAPDSVVAQVREKIGGLPEEELSSDSIRLELQNSLNQYNGNLVWEDADITDSLSQKVLPDQSVYLVIWLTVANLCYEMAARYAQTFRFIIETSDLDVNMPQIVKNYLDIAKQYEATYLGALGGTSTVEVFTARRRSTETGKYAEWYGDELQ